MKLLSTSEWGAIQVNTRHLRRTTGQGIVLHHTATPNAMARTGAAEEERAAALVRQIQRWHMGPPKRWLDTGQNFTVSRGGVICEGRTGSWDAAREGKVLQGAHAGNVKINQTHFGIESEGLYMDVEPPAALIQALIELCAHLSLWSGCQAHALYPHRQFRQTLCPGDQIVALLPDLREAIRARKLELLEAGS